MPSLALACRLSAVSRAFRRPFSPASLFSSGEQGVWYDPSDLSTLYQDAAGTTPVTAMEQPVGLVLDKSKGLVLGTQKWSDASTVFDGESSEVSPGVYRIYSSAGGFSDVHITGVLTVGKFYEIKFTVDSIATAGAGIIIDAINATAVTTTGAKRFVVLAPNTRIGIKRASACDIQISNISVRELPGNHATQATTTSRPTLQQDASGKYYLSFDGVDDFLQTNSIDFTTTDKMTVLSGMRVFSGHIFNTVVAQNYPNSPSWYHLLKRNLPAQLGVENGRRGSGSGSFTATPSDFGGLYDGNIVTAYAFDLARTPELVTQRVNGAVKISGYGIDTGVGPLANAPLYIGSTDATHNHLTGRLYGLIVRGAATDDDHLTHAEKYLAYKSGVTL